MKQLVCNSWGSSLVWVISLQTCFEPSVCWTDSALVHSVFQRFFFNVTDDIIIRSTPTWDWAPLYPFLQSAGWKSGNWSSRRSSTPSISGTMRWGSGGGGGWEGGSGTLMTLTAAHASLWLPQMIHNYMEHVERIKMQQFSDTAESSTVGRVRWEVESGGREYQAFLFLLRQQEKCLGSGWWVKERASARNERCRNMRYGLKPVALRKRQQPLSMSRGQRSERAVGKHWRAADGLITAGF